MVEEKRWRDPKKTARRRRGLLRPPAATLASVASGAFYQSKHRLFNRPYHLSITLLLCLELLHNLQHHTTTTHSASMPRSVSILTPPCSEKNSPQKLTPPSVSIFCPSLSSLPLLCLPDPRRPHRRLPCSTCSCPTSNRSRPATTSARSSRPSGVYHGWRCRRFRRRTRYLQHDLRWKWTPGCACTCCRAGSCEPAAIWRQL